MRRTILTILAACLALAGCSSSDEKAEDCAAALTEQTGGDPADKPTVSEAEARVDAFDKTLAGMVRSGYEAAAKEAYEATEAKFTGGGKDRPEACKSLSEDDYTALQTAKVIDGLGWTDEDGKFDKLKMVKGLG